MLPWIPHSRPWLTDEDRQSVGRTLSGGLLAAGEGVRAFERELATHLGTTDAVACGSGTAALVLALRGLGLGPQSEVICPSYVCSHVLAAVRAVGAAPVLCDLGVDGWCATPESVARAMTPRTGAIVAVHTFGTTANIAGMQVHGVPVIEDAAQAFGSTIDGVLAGTVGAVGIFSFHATKLLTTGEGGAVVARDPAVLQAMRAARDHHLVPSPLSDLAAALGRAQLARFDGMLARRQSIAARYLETLPAEVTAPLRRVSAGAVAFRFPLRIPSSSLARTESAFAEQRISVRRGVDEVNHRAEGATDALFTETVDRFETTVCLPVHPSLTDEEVDRVVEAAKRCLW